MTGLHLTSQRSFGSTPGTDKYLHKNTYEPQPVGLYIDPKTNTKIYGDVNLPLQYKDNALNQPPMYQFGRMVSLDNAMGPNMVGYEKPYNMYDGAGGNTMYWLENKPYLPEGKKLSGIQRTATNPRGWLSGSGMRGDLGKARSFTKNGLKYGGNLLFDPQPFQPNAELIYQPTPPYMNKNLRKFGGKTITLEKNGKIFISPK